MADPATVRLRFDVVLPVDVFADPSYPGIKCSAAIQQRLQEIFDERGIEVASFEFDGGRGVLDDTTADFQRVTTVILLAVCKPP